MHYRKLIVAVLMLACAGAMAQGTEECAVDLNGDGSIDEPNEMQMCTSSNGAYLCPIGAVACVVPTGSTTPTCPTNPALACINNPEGTPMCSPNPCFSATSGTTTPETNDPMPTSNATNPDGSCDTVNIRIFSGRAANCKGQGVETGFHDCCAGAGSMNDTMKTSQDAALSIFLTGLPIVPSCSSADVQTGSERASGYCHYIGDYCGLNVPLVGCTQQVHSYCCFSSMLARIIQEQGRAQLTEMGGFGTPTSPNCRGFTEQEFQSIDFSKVNLSEYYSELEYTTSQSFSTTY